MKIVYIPKGEIVSYDNLTTECLVVEGCLKVTYDLKVKKIIGGGSVLASSISADDIRADELESVRMACRRLIAKRVETSELFASESAAVSCLLSADYVKAGRLSVGLSDIDEVQADRWSTSGRRSGACSAFCWRPSFVRGGCASPRPRGT